VPWFKDLFRGTSLVSGGGDADARDIDRGVAAACGRRRGAGGDQRFGERERLRCKPLVPGVTYTLWVTGRNSRGDGLPSNVLTFTA